ncbi:signal-transducing adaptor protein 2 [Passer domesticus]|uniref:signal-transducing adaptor protein 2 n=1 Tax=Passer domesticus TaxID=48849 RepID=UPI0030FE88D0
MPRTGTPGHGDSRPPPFAPPGRGRPGSGGGSCAAAEMERPVPLPRGTRPRARHYYEGFVDKRGPRDQGYRRLWAGLRGLHLAFYRGPQDREVPGLLWAGPPGLETPPGWGPSGWDPQDKNLWVGLGGLPQAGTSGTPQIGTPPSCPGPGDAPGQGPLRVGPLCPLPVGRNPPDWGPVPMNPPGHGPPRTAPSGDTGGTPAEVGVSLGRGPTLGCPQPLELLDLGELVTVQAEDGALVLRLRGQEVTMKMESWETQEMWRGFILTMAKMKIPRDLALLPGHTFQLLQALREEQERRDSAVSPPATSVSPPTTSVSPPVTPVSPTTPVTPVTPVSPTTAVSPSPSEPVPSCFLQVTRAEAERLLEQSAARGNLLLRPGGHGQGVSVTTRQERGGTALLRHYRVKREAQGYVIDLETPHRCSSLAEVAQFFVRSSAGSLRPLEPEYSARLEFVPMNGDPSPAAATPRAAPRRGRSPPGLGLVPEEQLYMNDPGRTQELLRELQWKLQQRQAQ